MTSFSFQGKPNKEYSQMTMPNRSRHGHRGVYTPMASDNDGVIYAKVDKVRYPDGILGFWEFVPCFFRHPLVRNNNSMICFLTKGCPTKEGHYFLNRLYKERLT